MSTGDVEYIRKRDAHRIALHYGGDVCAQKIAELPALRLRKAQLQIRDKGDNSEEET